MIIIFIIAGFISISLSISSNKDIEKTPLFAFSYSSNSFFKFSNLFNNFELCKILVFELYPLLNKLFFFFTLEWFSSDFNAFVFDLNNKIFLLSLSSSSNSIYVKLSRGGLYKV